MKTKKIILLNHFDGEPRESDFAIEEEDLPQLAEDEFLCKALFFSVDPYMRPYSVDLKPPLTMIGTQVAKVLKSRSEAFPIGCMVVGNFGWRMHTVVNSSMTERSIFGVRQLPNLGQLPASYALGPCGMPGSTAYFGFLKVCQPKVGDTLVVTGAAGAVGSLVGQIGKISGCRVIGVAGTEAKCQWLKEIGFDAAINYKQCGGNITESLKKSAPRGIDCYFDNVGGNISHQVRLQMNQFGRVAVCGSISQYNKKYHDSLINTVPVPEFNIVMKQLKIEGFVVTRWDKDDTWNRGILKITEWIQQGLVQVKETITEGFENLPRSFIGMMNGDNLGKAIVKC